jgi:hypothetical protein
MAQISEDLTDLSARKHVYLRNSPRQTLLTPWCSDRSVGRPLTTSLHTERTDNVKVAYAKLRSLI